LAGVVRKYKTMNKLVLTPEALDRALGDMFTSMDGPARAFFEIPLRESVLRVEYQTIRLAMHGSVDHAGPALCLYAFAKFRALLQQEEVEDHSGGIIFWRRRPALAEFTDKTGRGCTCLSMRLALFGKPLDLAVPEGGEPIWI
jgi:hypothetical protein